MTNLKLYATIALLAGILALPVAANAEGLGTRDGQTSSTNTISSESFSAYDADRSGTLNENEYNEIGSSVDFNDADANDDDVITLSELNVSHTSGEARSNTAD